jgi:hypothetical protein
MALISLSEWLDRHGDAPSTLPPPSELDSLHLTASEEATPEAKKPVRESWRHRLDRAWRRACWRLRRHASGHA